MRKHDELFAAAERRVGGIPRDEMSKAERLIDDLAFALASAMKEKAAAWDEGANAWADDRWDGTGEGIKNPYRETDPT